MKNSFSKTQFDDLFLQEETLWKNKYRETWLTSKSLNTRIFHTSTLIKRRRNAIEQLKLSSGIWICEIHAIGSCFINYFHNLFTSCTPIIIDNHLSSFNCSILQEEIINLCSIPWEHEIFNALSCLGSTKARGPYGFTALFYKNNIGGLLKMSFSRVFGISSRKIIYWMNKITLLLPWFRNSWVLSRLIISNLSVSAILFIRLSPKLWQTSLSGFSTTLSLHINMLLFLQEISRIILY